MFWLGVIMNGRGCDEFHVITIVGRSVGKWKKELAVATMNDSPKSESISRVIVSSFNCLFFSAACGISKRHSETRAKLDSSLPCNDWVKCCEATGARERACRLRISHLTFCYLSYLRRAFDRLAPILFQSKFCSASIRDLAPIRFSSPPDISLNLIIPSTIVSVAKS